MNSLGTPTSSPQLSQPPSPPPTPPPAPTRTDTLPKRLAFSCPYDDHSTVTLPATADMPAVYHLHPTSTQAFTITPPASPPRRYVSQSPTTAASDLAGTVCSCGKEMFDRRGRCPACYERHERYERRNTRHFSLQPEPGFNAKEYTLQPRSTFTFLTPPPSTLPTPRQSLDASSNEMLDAANAMFPTEVHPRLPRLDASQSRTSTSYVLSPTSPASPPQSRGRPPVRKSSRPMSPDTELSYAPMAESFARLNMRDIFNDSQRAGSRKSSKGSTRSSFDLNAKMFEGAA